MNEQMKFPAGTAFGSIGHPIRRKEDARLLTGKGRFTDDFSVDGQTYAAMVRSPHPHARIVRIDTARGQGDAGRARRVHRRRLHGRRTEADPAHAGARDQVRHEADRARRRPGVRRPAHAAAGRQGAPRRRGGGDGGGRDARAGDGRRRGGRGRIRGAAVRHPLRGRAQARRAGGVGRSPRQRAVRHDVRRQGQDRPRLRRGRPCREGGVQHRPRHRRADGAALVPRRLRRGDRQVHALCRLRRRGAAEGRARPACSASRPTSCAFCPTTSAAISARATGRSSSSAWCCGRRASSSAR